MQGCTEGAGRRSGCAFRAAARRPRSVSSPHAEDDCHGQALVVLHSLQEGGGSHTNFYVELHSRRCLSTAGTLSLTAVLICGLQEFKLITLPQITWWSRMPARMVMAAPTPTALYTSALSLGPVSGGGSGGCGGPPWGTGSCAGAGVTVATAAASLLAAAAALSARGCCAAGNSLSSAELDPDPGCATRAWHRSINGT